MEGILDAVTKLQEQHKQLQERNEALEAQLADQAKTLAALREQVGRSGEREDLTARVAGRRDDAFLAKGLVLLNVGGVHFTTSATTLTAEPDSMLAAMFSGRYELERDQDGRAFIDRDGELFKHVLQYLRDGRRLDVSELAAGVRQRLKREAAFYCLPALERQLDQAAAGGGDGDGRPPASVFLRVTVNRTVVVGREGVLPDRDAIFSVQGSPWPIAERLPVPEMTLPRCRGSGYSESLVKDEETWWWGSFIPALLACFQDYHLVSVPVSQPKHDRTIVWSVHLNLR